MLSFSLQSKLILHTDHSRNNFTVSLVIFKRLKLQLPNCAHLEDYTMKINLLFFIKLSSGGRSQDVIPRKQKVPVNFLIPSFLFFSLILKMTSLFCSLYLDGLSFRNQVGVILQIFRCRLIYFLVQSIITLEAEISLVKVSPNFCHRQYIQLRCENLQNLILLSSSQLRRQNHGKAFPFLAKENVSPDYEAVFQSNEE